jgi:hypothetical protein
MAGFSFCAEPASDTATEAGGKFTNIQSNRFAG